MSSQEQLEFIQNSLSPFIEEEQIIHTQTHLVNDLFLDSVALLSLATDIENKYKIFLPDDFENPPETVDDILRLIEQGLKDKVCQ